MKSPRSALCRCARSARTAAAAGLVSTAGACFYVPDVQTAPEEADSPPFVLGFDPDVVVDLRGSPRDVAFAVEAVYDLNPVEAISYRFLARLQPDDARPVEISGRLTASDIQPYSDVTTYRGPAVTFRTCRPPLAGADGAIVTITLELVDALPDRQRFDALEQYVVPLTWRVRLDGTCDAP